MSGVVKVIIFLLVSLTNLYEDQRNKQCTFQRGEYARAISRLIATVHSLYSTYFYLGSILFGFYYTHFIIGSINLITWIFGRLYYGVGCPATYLYNKWCIPERGHVQFRDIVYKTTERLHLKNDESKIGFVILLAMFVLLFDAYNIFVAKTN